MNNQEDLFSKIPYEDIDRTDNMAYPIFDRIYKLMQKQFWIPETISMGEDYYRFKDLPDDVKQLYTINLQWQIHADSSQTPNLMYLLENITNNELKRCVVFQLQMENLHSASYNYIVASMYDNPTEMLDEVTTNELIVGRIQKVAEINDTVCESVYDASISMLAMEAISFTSSFLVTMVINHLYPNKINNTFVQIQKIAADEASHVLIFSNVVKILLDQGKVNEKQIRDSFSKVIKAEMVWSKAIYNLCSLPQLKPKVVEELLKSKAESVIRGLGLPGNQNESSQLTSWYNRNININNTVTEQQAAVTGAYVTDILIDDWT